MSSSHMEWVQSSEMSEIIADLSLLVQLSMLGPWSMKKILQCREKEKRCGEWETRVGNWPALLGMQIEAASKGAKAQSGVQGNKMELQNWIYEQWGEVRSCEQVELQRWWGLPKWSWEAGVEMWKCDKEAVEWYAALSTSKALCERETDWNALKTQNLKTCRKTRL